MVQELVQAAFLIFVAEMGDKTQLLAMAFALQFSIIQVLGGVALGSFLNHGLAVALGAYVSQLVPLELIRLIAACGFLGFGLWTLYNRQEEEHLHTPGQGHPILVVALAFFIGELGDKTQLSAIALSSRALYPEAVLAGTVLGMVLTSLVGIGAGIKLGEKVPERTLRLISAFVFIGFGVLGLWRAVPPHLLTAPNIAVFLGALAAAIILLIVPPLWRTRRTEVQGKYTQMQRVARELKRHLAEIEAAVDDICLSEKHCGVCRGKDCPVGYCRDLVRQALRDHLAAEPHGVIPRARTAQRFDEAKIRHALALVRQEYPDCESMPEIETIIRRTEAVLRTLESHQTS
ncbi:MAG: TMEM165/GDT1 family protein [Firmicutes bacterium]|jgi:putative Ca2+/H+ antiporter (TMEM165/GDT1 family)|nr:TMEM165/GDT1 family protein [Bacillota bacterium]